MEPLHARTFNPLQQFTTLPQFESQEYVLAQDTYATCEPYSKTELYHAETIAALTFPII